MFICRCICLCEIVMKKNILLKTCIWSIIISIVCSFLCWILFMFVQLRTDMSLLFVYIFICAIILMLSNYIFMQYRKVFLKKNILTLFCKITLCCAISCLGIIMHFGVFLCLVNLIEGIVFLYMVIWPILLLFYLFINCIIMIVFILKDQENSFLKYLNYNE